MSFELNIENFCNKGCLKTFRVQDSNIDKKIQ